PVLSAEVDWLTPTGSEIHGDYRMRVVGSEGTAELYWGRGRCELTTAAAPRHDVELTAGRRPAQDALDALIAGEQQAKRARRDALLASHSSLLDEESARAGGIDLHWEQTSCPTSRSSAQDSSEACTHVSSIRSGVHASRLLSTRTKSGH